MPDTDTALLRAPDRFFIGGEWTAPRGDSRIDVINSGTEEVFVSVAEAQEDDVNRAVAAARDAFDNGPWPRLSPRERAVFLRAIADECDARAEDFARIWTTESGVIFGISLPAATSIGGIFRYYAGLADTFAFVEEHVPQAGGASICGERIARCTLELGGKSAAVILDDYDLTTAAETIAAGSTFLTGQVCSSLTRLVVPRNRHDDLVDALGEAYAKVTVGDPFDAGSHMGPLAMRRQRDRVEEMIAKGTDEGATLAVGGRRPANLNRGFFIEPTVFANVSNSQTIAREEIFGPVLSVIPAEDEEGAIRIANDTVFGLNASVFTNDVDRAYAVARRLRSGTVGHNAFRSDFSIAFGGFKQSGIGREGGVEGLLPYLESKTLILDAKPSSYGF